LSHLRASTSASPISLPLQSISRSKTYSDQIVSRQPDINRPIERSQTSASCESERSDWRRTSSSRGARETQAMMESILRVRSMRDLFLTHRQHQVIQSMSARERERESIGNRRRRRREAHDTHRLTRLESAPPSAEEIDPRKPRFPDSCLCTQVQVRRRPQPRESREFSSQHRTSLVDRMVLDAQSVEIGKHQILPVREISAQVIAFQVAAHRSVERERERERARERERDRESER